MSKTFNIDSYTLKNRYILAPLAGYSNRALRLLAREAGAALTYTEMISATALVYGNRKTFEMLPKFHDESPLALQLFGGDKEVILRSIPIIESEAVYDFLDFNMGCPVPKVMKQKAGSYWMSREDEVYDLLHAMVQASHKPLLIKIRLGFSRDRINAAEIARIAEAAGVKAIAVHGRTRDQYYAGTPDYSQIASVKRAVSVPVIANGNIDAGNIKYVEEKTGADAFMIGRAALGNPDIFQELLAVEENISLSEKTPSRQALLMRRHLCELCALMGEANAVRYFRGLAVLYVKGFTNAKKIKNTLVTMETIADFDEAVTDFLHE